MWMSVPTAALMLVGRSELGWRLEVVLRGAYDSFSSMEFRMTEDNSPVSVKEVNARTMAIWLADFGLLTK